MGLSMSIVQLHLIVLQAIMIYELLKDGNIETKIVYLVKGH
jgi:hypothetical protein